VSSFSFFTHKESLHCPQRKIAKCGGGGHSYPHQMKKTYCHHPLRGMKDNGFQTQTRDEWGKKLTILGKSMYNTADN